MPFETLFQPLDLRRGPTWRNRFALAPLTNRQSRPDGVLSEQEIRWLTMRAEGGFGLVMTAAAQVQPVGQGFAGQLAASGDAHIPGLRRLADQIRALGAVSSVQLHHAGARADRAIVGQPVSASDDAATGARALTLDEVERLRDDFIAAALRAETAGFDGVELHAAHGYIFTQFLAAATNRREDRYGGDLDGRSRLLFEVIDGIRAGAGRDFQLGVRLSVERFVPLVEGRETVRRLFDREQLDFLDLSLFDVFKETIEPEHRERPLLGWFTDLDRKGTRLAAAGALSTPVDVERAIQAGLDFAVIGRAAILHHDYPRRLRTSGASFRPTPLPVSVAYLEQEGVSPPFVDYLREFGGSMGGIVAAD